MPQRSYAFAVAHVRALENGLLDSAKFVRMKDADLSGALHILQESGYGSAGKDADDIEGLIQSELKRVRRTVWEITPDPVQTRLFLLQNDAHNLKTLLKARLLNEDASDILVSGGAFGIDLLQRCVEAKDYRDLPDAFSQALNALEKQLAAKPDAHVLSAAVDNAVFACIWQTLDRINRIKSAFSRRYFSAQADFLNVRSMVRARALGYGTDRLAGLLVAGGEISIPSLCEALELPAEQLPGTLGLGANGKAIAQALEGYVQDGSTQALEDKMDEALMVLVRAGRSDSFGLGPVVGYLLGREAEARALRLLFAGKRTGRECVLPALYVS